jgi:hypothetical protein
VDYLRHFFIASILAGHIVLFKLASLFRIKFTFPSSIREGRAVVVIVFVCAVVAVFGLYQAPPSAGFNIEDSYNRRIEARDIFTRGSIFAYLNSIILNGFSPFLAFIAGYRRKVNLFFFAGCIALCYFYVLGTKAPVLYVVLSYFVGGVCIKGRLSDFTNKLTMFFIFLIFLSLVEFYFFDISLIAELLIRRAMAVPAYLISAYFDFISDSIGSAWSILSGVDSIEPISLIIGESYLGMPGLNANTNTFIYSLASGGIPSYLIVVFLVIAFFYILDVLHRVKNSAMTIFVGFLSSLLLTEQAFSTLFISSGIGILLGLCIFVKPDKNQLPRRFS